MSEPKMNMVFCPTEILLASDIRNAPYNNHGVPIWIDFSPGSYVDPQGNEVYTSSYKCEYVDKELIRSLVRKYKETKEEIYLKAIDYWLEH